MSWVDLVVIALALLAAISGWRHGMAVALLSFVGVLGGAIIGVRVAPLLAEDINNPNTRVIVSVAVVVMLVVLGETTGVFLGRRVRDRITGEHFLAVDSTLGSILQALAVVVAAWLVALPLASASLPGIAAGVRGSQVLSAVDAVMPTAAKQLPAELRQLLDNSGFPDVLSPFARTPVTATGPPDAALVHSAAVATAQPSVLKIRGKAPSCQRQLEGSGFVIAPELVMTNAHVVAGTDSTAVEVTGRKDRITDMPARVVYYDPKVDVAVLRVPNLTAKPLCLRRGPRPLGRRRDRARLPARRPVHGHPGPDPAGDQPEGAGHLRQRRGQPRRLHRPRDRALRQLRRPDDRPGGPGHGRGLRRGAGRPRDRVRAHRRAGAGRRTGRAEPHRRRRDRALRRMTRERITVF